MTINLADNDPRNEYTVSDGNSQTVFTMDFEIFDNADLNVYVDGVLQTLTTHYKISDLNNNANAGHTSGTDGFVHFTSAVTASGSDKKIVLTRSIVLQRTTDFPSAGPFDIASLNTELDRVTAIQADLKDDIDRSLRLTDFDVDATLTLPAVDTRKGKTLAFNATSGAVEAGPSISDVQTVSAAAADIQTVAHLQDGTTTSNGISTLAGISSNISTVASIGVTAMTNVSGKATEIGLLGTTAAVADMAILGTTAVVADMDILANVSTDITTLAHIEDGTTATNAIQTVASANSNITAIAGQISPTNNIATVAGDSTEIGTLAAISSDITALANAIGVATTYAVTVVGGVFYLDGASKPALTLVRGNTYIFDQSDSSNASHPLAFRDSSDNSYTTGVTVTGTAGQAGAKVTIDVASNAPSSLKYYCTTHGNNMGNTITVVNSNLATVASNITNVNNVGSNISAVTTASSNISAIQGASQAATDAATARDSAKAISAAMGAALDSFDDRYLGTMADNATAPTPKTPTITTTNGSADVTVSDATGLSIGMLVTSANIPAGTNVVGISGTTVSLSNSATAAGSGTSSTFAGHGVFGTFNTSTDGPATDNDNGSLVTGALYFNTTDNEMRVYDGANWIAASAAGSASMNIFEYTVSGSPTATFSGVDDNTATLSYTQGNIQVVKDGVVLHADDFTATNGTSVVLQSNAAVGSEIVIYAFKSFTVADTVSRSSGGNFLSNIQINGADVATTGKAIAMAIVFGG